MKIRTILCGWRGAVRPSTTAFDRVRSGGGSGSIGMGIPLENRGRGPVRAGSNPGEEGQETSSRTRQRLGQRGRSLGMRVQVKKGCGKPCRNSSARRPVEVDLKIHPARNGSDRMVDLDRLEARTVDPRNEPMPRYRTHADAWSGCQRITSIHAGETKGGWTSTALLSQRRRMPFRWKAARMDASASRRPRI
eukprot:scaffold436_cov336-Pavlova_lutheri.AAC.19